MELTDAERILSQALPDGGERDALLELLRIGSAFKTQHQGRKPGYLRQYIHCLVEELETRSFEGLLRELEYRALMRSLQGERSSPIEKVDRSFELITWHDPRHGRSQTTFKRVANIAQLRRKSREPVTRET